MSNLINIDQLATKIFSGGSVNKEKLGTGNYPAIHFSDMFKHRVVISECRFFVNPDLIKNKKYIEYGDLLVCCNSETRDQIGKALVYLGKDKPLSSAGIKIIRHKENPKWLAYLFNCDYVKRQLRQFCTYGTIYNLPKRVFSRIVVPWVPISRQNEMVNQIDLLEGHMVNLEKDVKEISQLRKKQCKFISSRLFDHP